MRKTRMEFSVISLSPSICFRQTWSDLSAKWEGCAYFSCCTRQLHNLGRGKSPDLRFTHLSTKVFLGRLNGMRHDCWNNTVFQRIPTHLCQSLTWELWEGVDIEGVGFGGVISSMIDYWLSSRHWLNFELTSKLWGCHVVRVEDWLF